LEHWLGGSDSLQPKHAPLLKTLITSLQQDIQNTGLITAPQFPEPQSPLLLVISADALLNQALLPVAAHCGIQIETVPTLEAACKTLSQAHLIPNVILLRWLPDLNSNSASNLDSNPFASLAALQNLAHPSPILVMGESHSLSERLEILRRGVKLFLEASTSPEQVMAAVINLLRESQPSAKVMVVDDDPVWLNTLPTLLKPWGFKVTTLANPEQFWSVLEAVMPDMLVLDVKMPQINGFELCQILRSDPQWQRLPVLFLSVLNDAASQHQAFSVGADDYICKPVIGVALANRILSRLHRVRAYAS
jgi:DNA-binding response OmpR family regulator